MCAARHRDAIEERGGRLGAETLSVIVIRQDGALAVSGACRRSARSIDGEFHHRSGVDTTLS